MSAIPRTENNTNIVTCITSIHTLPVRTRKPNQDHAHMAPIEGGPVFPRGTNIEQCLIYSEMAVAHSSSNVELKRI